MKVYTDTSQVKADCSGGPYKSGWRKKKKKKALTRAIAACKMPGIVFVFSGKVLEE